MIKNNKRITMINNKALLTLILLSTTVEAMTTKEDAKENLQQVKNSGTQQAATKLFFHEGGGLMTAKEWESFYGSPVDSEWSQKKQEENLEASREEWWRALRKRYIKRTFRH